jgi:hypothetical protein
MIDNGRRAPKRVIEGKSAQQNLMVHDRGIGFRVGRLRRNKISSGAASLAMSTVTQSDAALVGIADDPPHQARRVLG